MALLFNNLKWLSSAIVREIEGWTEGTEIKIRLADDGDGHMDVMGLTVTDLGLAKLEEVLRNASDAVKHS